MSEGLGFERHTTHESIWVWSMRGWAGAEHRRGAGPWLGMASSRDPTRKGYLLQGPTCGRFRCPVSGVGGGGSLNGGGRTQKLLLTRPQDQSQIQREPNVAFLSPQGQCCNSSLDVTMASRNTSESDSCFLFILTLEVCVRPQRSLLGQDLVLQF